MELKPDVLIAGAGLGGVLLALELVARRPELQIILANPVPADQSASWLAQGGIAASLPGNTYAENKHVDDTIKAGAGVNNIEVVRSIVLQSAAVIDCLEKYGVQFDKSSAGGADLALEGGHSIHRILHHKDFTGQHIMQTLLLALQNAGNVTLLEHTEIVDLAVQDGEVCGALLWNSKTQTSLPVHCGHVVLATGGVGGLFRFTTNPPAATGTAIGLAAKTGATLADLHYIQFHPTALWLPREGRLPLISEAVRGAGAVLRNQAGEAFMAAVHPAADLAPRDVVSRAIVNEIQAQSVPYVFLDCTLFSESEFANEFPAIARICIAAGFSPARDLLPVVPVAHYSCGGVKTDIAGRCGINGLYVIGEAACTGFHGANRLASNSLLEACVMAINLAEHLASQQFDRPDNQLYFPVLHPEKSARLELENLVDTLRALMHNYCSVLKTTAGLDLAAAEIADLKAAHEKLFAPDLVESYKARLILSAAEEIVAHARQAVHNVGVFYNTSLASGVELCNP